jgi:hypothetical protein
MPRLGRRRHACPSPTCTRLTASRHGPEQTPNSTMVSNLEYRGLKLKDTLECRWKALYFLV